MKSIACVGIVVCAVVLSLAGVAHARTLTGPTFISVTSPAPVPVTLTASGTSVVSISAMVLGSSSISINSTSMNSSGGATNTATFMVSCANPSTGSGSINFMSSVGNLTTNVNCAITAPALGVPGIIAMLIVMGVVAYAVMRKSASTLS